jgi:hypothetical protein
VSHRRWIGLVALGAIPLVAPTAADADRQRPAPFDDARLEIEYNATDGDAGFQVFADAEEWKEFEILQPNGNRLVDLKATGVLGDFGLSELFAESSEPPFTELPFAEFKRLFPAGNYRFEGETIDGRELRSVVRFSHAVLDPPQFLAPTDGGTLAAGAAVIRWVPVAGAVDYEVIVTREDPLRVLDVTLPADATSLTVPAEFLDAAVEYKVELHASHAGGNRIFTEVGFTPT